MLLAAGMSTPTLRTVACAGVDISGAGYTEIAFPCLDLGPFLLHGLLLTAVLSIYVPEIMYRWIPSIVSLCCRLALLAILWCRPQDERCFTLKMMAKMIAMHVGITGPVVVMTKITPSSTDYVYLAIPLFIMTMHIAMLGFACLLATTCFVICTEIRPEASSSLQDDPRSESGTSHVALFASPYKSAS